LGVQCRGTELRKRWAAIPEDTEILILHGPPYGIGDLAPAFPSIGRRTPEHVGSRSLRERIEQLPRLRLAVFGHIHSGRGGKQLGTATLANVSLVNEGYEPVHPPWTGEL
jgi:Icc-related predicted phosphoesterase